VLWILDFRFLAARASSLAAGLIEMQDDPCRNRRWRAARSSRHPRSTTVRALRIKRSRSCATGWAGRPSGG